MHRMCMHSPRVFRSLVYMHVEALGDISTFLLSWGTDAHFRGVSWAGCCWQACVCLPGSRLTQLFMWVLGHRFRTFCLSHKSFTHLSSLINIFIFIPINGNLYVLKKHSLKHHSQVKVQERMCKYSDIGMIRKLLCGLTNFWTRCSTWECPVDVHCRWGPHLPQQSQLKIWGHSLEF